jgi:hypothetical protein
LVPETSTCDFSFSFIVKYSGGQKQTSFRNIEKGSWNLLSYETSVVPTQIEFQKIDPLSCDAYFTNLTLTGRQVLDESESSKASAVAVFSFVAMMMILSFLLLM